MTSHSPPPHLFSPIRRPSGPSADWQRSPWLLTAQVRRSSGSMRLSRGSGDLSSSGKGRPRTSGSLRRQVPPGCSSGLHGSSMLHMLMGQLAGRLPAVHAAGRLPLRHGPASSCHICRRCRRWCCQQAADVQIASCKCAHRSADICRARQLHAGGPRGPPRTRTSLHGPRRSPSPTPPLRSRMLTRCCLNARKACMPAEQVQEAQALLQHVTAPADASFLRLRWRPAR